MKSAAIVLLSLALLVTHIAAFQAQPMRRNSVFKMGKRARKMTPLQAARNNHPSNYNRFAPFERTRAKTEIAVSSSSLLEPLPFQIYCDLDGVLCDFDAGVRSLSKGVAADDLPIHKMWGLIHEADRFYEKLAWNPGGRLLWESIRPHSPSILTGVSMGKTCPDEKARWCRRELGVETNHVCKAASTKKHDIVKGQLKDGVVNVITCWSKNKHFESCHRA